MHRLIKIVDVLGIRGSDVLKHVIMKTDVQVVLLVPFQKKNCKCYIDLKNQPSMTPSDVFVFLSTSPQPKMDRNLKNPNLKSPKG